jgi:predicted nucleotidyltransferase
MNFDLDKHTIFKTLTGSRVYGTSNEDSDYDYRGVCIPPERYWLGYASRFDQHEQRGEDSVIFGFSKFLHLAAQNNPNIIELLYIPEKYWEVSSPYWLQLIEHRDWFLSKKCYHTYRGYAASQLRRLRGHRDWLLKGDLKKPERSDFGLSDARQLPMETISAAHALIERHLNRFPLEEELSSLPKDDAMGIRYLVNDFLAHITQLTLQEVNEFSWVSAGRALGFDDNLLELLKKEKAYQRAVKEYKSWLHWKAERNPRRRETEEQSGFDRKHAMHLVRLLISCRDILRDGTLTVECPDAEEILLPIKRGEWSYEQLMDFESSISEELSALYAVSTLQKSPRRNDIEDLGIEITKQFLAENK